MYCRNRPSSTYGTIFRDDIGPDTSSMPISRDGYNYINPKAITDKYSTEYAKHPEHGTYISADPRLAYTPRAQRLELDRPPFRTSHTMDEIAHDRSLDRYGQDYRDYKDIRAGQIVYYTSDALDSPFYPPIFSNTARIVGYDYTDPMGSSKPQYFREPLTNPDYLHTDRGPYSYPHMLSWIRDTNEHREDLMASQMRKRNQQRWSPRWPKDSYHDRNDSNK